MMHRVIAAALLPVALMAVALAQSPAEVDQWPAWRGPLSTGESVGGDPPVDCSETSNVAWKTRIPGAGASTPVIWNDTIYLQTASPVGDEKPTRQTSFAFAEEQKVYHGLAYVRATRDYEFALVAVHRATGRIRWQTPVRHEQPAEGRHCRSSSMASSTSVRTISKPVPTSGTDPD